MTLPADIAIRLSGVSKKYRLFDDARQRLKEALDLRGRTYHKDFWALRDIDITIPKGHTIGILGRNGVRLRRCNGAEHGHRGALNFIARAADDARLIRRRRPHGGRIGRFARGQFMHRRHGAATRGLPGQSLLKRSDGRVRRGAEQPPDDGSLTIR